MVLPTARKPEGGFQFVSVEHLCAVWSAYRLDRIRLADVRLWCAAQELVARRCQLATGQQPHYQLSELQRLVGGARGLPSALARLQVAGLLVWEPTGLTFTLPANRADDSLMAMLALIPNNRRRVPVPRRLLRFTAKDTSRAVLATILGHLFRCLYYRHGVCHAEGFCKASWIAQVFGVSERAVKSARRRLEAIGFLQRTETPQWVCNRYGQKMTINLQWEAQAPSPTVLSQPTRKTAPPVPPAATKITPPDSYTKLLTEEKYQKPAGGGPTGVLSTLFLQARQCMRNGTSLPEPAPPVLKLTAPAPRLPIPSPALAPQGAPVSPPLLRHVLPIDLQKIDRLLELYTQAVQTYLIGPSEAERLAFVALAHHVLHFQPSNPGGLFVHLLRQRQFAVITQEEEETAQRRLRTHLYGRPPCSAVTVAA